MPSIYCAFIIVCNLLIALFTKVTKVNSCSMIDDKALTTQRLPSDETGRPYDADTEDMFKKCDAGGDKTCSHCVASGYKLVNVSYLISSRDETLTRLVYKVTGCQCAARKPLNIVEETPAPRYMERDVTMKYCTYSLAAVSALLAVTIILLCLRYELCCSKQKSEKTQPLAAKISKEENVVWLNEY